MLTIALVSLISISLPTGQDPTLEERRALSDEFLTAPRLVRGGSIRARWLDDGSSFWFRHAGQSTFVDPTEGQPRKATREDRGRVLEEEQLLRGGRHFAPGTDHYVTLVAGELKLGEDGEEGDTVLAERASEDDVWMLEPECWTTDGEAVFAWKLDISGVHRVPVIDFSSAVEALDEFPYVKSGEPMATFEVVIFDRATKERTVVDLGPDEERYVFVLGWREGDEELLLLRMNREATRLELMAANRATGASRVILTDQQETFVGGLDFITGGWRAYFTPIEGTDQFLWLSERDGWRQLYRYDYDGTLLGRVTEGEYPVERVVEIDAERGLVYFAANAEARPYDTHLCRAGLDGSELRRLTDGEGEHEVQLSPSKLWFVDNWSGPEQPPVAELRSTDGELVCVLAEADVSRLEAIGWTPPEHFVTLADDGETELHGVLYKPKWFDPARRYPVIDLIYSGPFITVVPHDFGMGSPHAIRAGAMAQYGFIVFVVDPRGTTERGKAFQDASYGRIGEIEVPDHVATLHQIAASRPYMDTERVGVYGHSWGGYFALRAMLTAPEVFRAGVSGAPGDLTESAPINEPYMRLPENNPEGYAKGSNPALADRLQGELLIIHGTADRNAPFSTSMRMVHALIRADKAFDLLVMPGVDHYPRGHEGTYMTRRIADFFLEHLEG